MQDPSHVVEHDWASSVVEHVKRETACCDHPTQQTAADVRNIGCRNKEDPFLDRESFQRVFLIQFRCQKPAQEPELTLHVKILNDVGELQPHEIEFDLALRWHGVLPVSGNPVGRLAQELCCRVLRHLRCEKLIEQ